MQPRRKKPLDGMYLELAKAEMIIRLLVEGSSVATVERVTGVHHGTILKLPVLVGEKCERIMAEKIRNVEVRIPPSTQDAARQCRSVAKRLSWGASNPLAPKVR